MYFVEGSVKTGCDKENLWCIVFSCNGARDDGFLFLTLGVHSQRGLLYLVCVPVCLCIRSRFLPLDATRLPKLYSNGFGATFASFSNASPILAHTKSRRNRTPAVTSRAIKTLIYIPTLTCNWAIVTRLTTKKYLNCHQTIFLERERERERAGSGHVTRQDHDINTHVSLPNRYYVDW